MDKTLKILLAGIIIIFTIVSIQALKKHSDNQKSDFILKNILFEKSDRAKQKSTETMKEHLENTKWKDKTNGTIITFGLNSEYSIIDTKKNLVREGIWKYEDNLLFTKYFIGDWARETYERIDTLNDTNLILIQVSPAFDTSIVYSYTKI